MALIFLLFFFALLSARPPLAQGLRSQPGDGLGFIFEVLSDVQKSVPRSIYLVDVISNFASANFSKSKSPAQVISFFLF